MIINNTQQAEVLGIDKDTTINMSIDDSDKALLMLILSQGLYSDAVGSLIRELTTNALDAQRESGNTNPIKVSLVKEYGKFVFSVQDQGIGLSPDRVEHVFAKYLSSTKRDNNEQLGFFGLGSKSPLAYTDSFNIISIHDGTEYRYMMLKGEEGTQLSLLDINDSDKPNGVTIKVTLREETDYLMFIEKMKKQLAYFEGVFITTEFNDISNDFKIIKNENWKYSELNQDKYLHIAMDNVYYSIDFDKLGIEPIAIPMALTLSLTEGIIPVPSREQLLYTPQTKALILAKMKVLADFLITKWNTIAPEAPDLFTAERLYNSHGTVELWNSGEDIPVKSISVKIDKKIQQVSDIPLVSVSMPLYLHLPLKRMIEVKNSMFNEWQVTAKIDPWKYTTKLTYLPYANAADKNLWLKEGESLSKTQVEFIKYKQLRLNIIRHTHPLKLGRLRKINRSADNYYGILHLGNIPYSEWRATICEYQALLKTYTDKWLTMADVTPDQAFLDWRKANRKHGGDRRLILKGEITVGVGREKEIYDQYNKPVFDKEVWKIENLHRLKKNDAGLYIYTTDDRATELYPYFQIGMMCKQGKRLPLKVAILSERSMKKLKGLAIPNWINLDEVLTKKNRVLSNFLSKRVEKQLKFDYNSYLNKTCFIKFINKAIDENVVALETDIATWKYLDLIPKNLLYKLLVHYNNKKWLTITGNTFFDLVPNLEFLPAIATKNEWEYNDASADQYLEVKLSKALYAKYAIKNFRTNKTRDFNQYIRNKIEQLAPPDEWDDIRDDDDSSDVQPGAF